MDSERSNDSTSEHEEIFPGPSTGPHAWNDIFATSKLVISIEPRNLQNPFLTIHHAHQDFLLNFGFSEDQLPRPLSTLFGPTTERNKIIRLERCLLSGKTFSEFINLHKSNGGSLSCYVSLLCLTNHHPAHYFSVLAAAGGSEVVKFGVLTIRSASVVGNSKFSGIGLMGTERVSRERLLQEIPSVSH